MSAASAFTPQPFQSSSKTTTTTTTLFEEESAVIEPLEPDAVYFDAGSGGVRLAAESALKIYGTIQHAPGKAECLPQDLLRYTQLQPVDESTVQSTLQAHGHSILCSGQGVEFYKDPGETVVKEVKYGPMEAIKDSLQNAGSAMDSDSLQFNFLGGDDLNLGEIVQAAEALTLDLDIRTSCQIAFNSCCHASIPSGTCTVTVVSVNGNDGENSSAKSGIAAGEVYLRDGQYYTLDEADINTAVA